MLREVSRQLSNRWQHRGVINLLLYPLSLLYIMIVTARKWAFDLNLLQRHKLPVPVIVIGNLSVGGVGKTPLVIALVEHLTSCGWKPGVIARGYHGTSTHWPREVDEKTPAEEVGDEPKLVFNRCRVAVVADPVRVRGARWLVEKCACDIIVSDDGFQHFALMRDLDIVVVDGERRFANGWCLPAGALREPPSALARAGLVVVHGDATAKQAMDGEYTMHTHIDRARSLDGTKTRRLAEFAEQHLHAVAGIGNPARFFRQLSAHGIHVTPHEYPDHHGFTAADFAFASDGAGVLMTEKDAVKCAGFLPQEIASRCWVVAQQVSLADELLREVDRRINRLT